MSTLSIQYIPVQKIHLDERNPRVAPALEGMTTTPEQSYIQLALGQFAPDDDEKGASTTYSSLKASIRAYEGLIHPIVVTRRPNGEFVVIEGNTRVAIYRELAHEKAPGNWDFIPAIVRDKIAEDGEHAIRLQAHLVGPRPWRPYAKAKYLHGLYADKKLSVTQILDFCGGSARKREIEEYIAAYVDMQEHYMPMIGQNQPDYSRFSAYVEVQKPQVKQALARAGYSMSDFTKWVHESKIYPLSTVRQLPRILSHPEAKKRFLSHDARDAMRVLEQPSSTAVVRDASLETLALALAAKIRNMEWPQVKALIEDPESSQAQSLSECFDELRALCKQFNSSADE